MFWEVNRHLTHLFNFTQTILAAFLFRYQRSSAHQNPTITFHGSRDKDNLKSCVLLLWLKTVLITATKKAFISIQWDLRAVQGGSSQNPSEWCRRDQRVSASTEALSLPIHCLTFITKKLTRKKSAAIMIRSRVTVTRSLQKSSQSYIFLDSAR